MALQMALGKQIRPIVAFHSHDGNLFLQSFLKTEPGQVKLEILEEGKDDSLSQSLAPDYLRTMREGASHVNGCVQWP